MRTDITSPLEVLLTLDFPQSFLDEVRAVDDRIVLHHYPVADDADPARAVPSDLLSRCEVMYTSAVLPGADDAPRLRWAQLDTSGIDHVRGTAMWDSECAITTLGGVSPAPLAEWILAMVLTHAHHLRQTERLAATHTWPSREYRWNELMPHNLRASTIAIVGYGRIGKEVARMARAFGMEVLAVRRGTPDAGIDGASSRFGWKPDVDGVTEVPLSDLERALAQSQYVALTVPLTPQTTGMIGADQIAAMRPDAVLINGSRGGVVDEEALLTAMDGGHLSLYASDVFDAEPLPAEHPFWSHDRVLVTPHVAGFAPDYLEVVSALFTANLRRYLDDQPLLNIASRERGY